MITRPHPPYSFTSCHIISSHLTSISHMRACTRSNAWTWLHMSFKKFQKSVGNVSCIVTRVLFVYVSRLAGEVAACCLAYALSLCLCLSTSRHGEAGLESPVRSTSRC